MTWRKWESITYHHDQTVKSKKVLKTKTGALEELVLELLQEVAFLAQHLFVANWQKDMFNSAKQLPCSSTDTVVMVLDFAENYGCFHQDEIQTAHWAVNHMACYSYKDRAIWMFPRSGSWWETIVPGLTRKQ